jgi:selenocysteine-specific elongation factor
VRGVESHGARVADASSGSRAAVALGGIDREEISPRGAWLVREEDPWKETVLMRADVALLDGAPFLGPRTRVRLHLGTAELGARVVAVGGPLAPGERRAVRLSLDAPVVARAGDRFVLRHASPVATIGGGVITDPAPLGRRVKPWSRAGVAVADRLTLIAAEAGGRGAEIASLSVRLGVPAAEAERLIKRSGAVERVSGRIYAAELVESVAKRVQDIVRQTHRTHPLEPGAGVQSLRSSIRVAAELLDHVVAAAVEKGKLRLADGFVSQPGWNPGASESDPKIAALLAALGAAGPSAPSVDELAPAHGRDTLPMLKLLVRSGRAVQLSGDRFISVPARDQLVSALKAALADGVELTTSELRENTGLTRKYLIPFLEYCDRSGITVRKGDVRVLA